LACRPCHELRRGIEATRSRSLISSPDLAQRLIPADTRLIYLDLNQWIALAKANSGHPDGSRWRSALEALRELRTVDLPNQHAH